MKQHGHSRTWLYFVLGSYGLSWLVWIWGIRQGNVTSIQAESFAPFLWVGSFAPAFMALLLTALGGGLTAVRQLLQPLLLFKMPWWAYLMVFFMIPSCGFLLSVLFAVPIKLEWWKIALTLIVFAPINGLIGGVIFGIGPLGEELGWRGFLLPRFLEHFRDEVLAVIIGCIWAVWHAPLFFFSDWRNGISLELFTILYPISLVLLSYSMLQVYRLSQGSLSIAIWFHGLFNVSAQQLSSPDVWTHTNPLVPWGIILGSLLITALVFAWLKTQTGASAKLHQSRLG